MPNSGAVVGSGCLDECKHNFSARFVETFGRKCQKQFPMGIEIGCIRKGSAHHAQVAGCRMPNSGAVDGSGCLDECKHNFSASFVETFGRKCQKQFPIGIEIDAIEKGPGLTRGLQVVECQIPVM